jgi:hypothetical protein
LALLDDGHPRPLGPKLDASPFLGFGQEVLANSRRLKEWAHGKHADVRTRCLPSQKNASHEFATSRGQQQACVCIGENAGQFLCIGALTIEQIGFGGPTCATRIAAIGALDQADNIGHVRGSRVSKIQFLGAGDRLHGGRITKPAKVRTI